MSTATWFTKRYAEHVCNIFDKKQKSTSIARQLTLLSVYIGAHRSRARQGRALHRALGHKQPT